MDSIQSVQNNKIDLIKKLIIEYKTNQKITPYNLFNSEYSKCVINNSIDLINKNQKNAIKKIKKIMDYLFGFKSSYYKNR